MWGDLCGCLTFSLPSSHPPPVGDVSASAGQDQPQQCTLALAIKQKKWTKVKASPHCLAAGDGVNLPIHHISMGQKICRLKSDRS